MPWFRVVQHSIVKQPLPDDAIVALLPVDHPGDGEVGSHIGGICGDGDEIEEPPGRGKEAVCWALWEQASSLARERHEAEPVNFSNPKVA